MRRTTICRSERPALLAAALLLAGAAARAQEVPATHTVAPGETLWAIAQMYYNDPLLWPEIYRLNTAVVEDPHWIYPGEVLTLAPGAAVAQGPVEETPADTVRAEIGDTAAAPEVPPEAAAESDLTIFDTRPDARQRVVGSLEGYLNQPYRPVRRGEFYSAGFLTERERLPWARVIRGTDTPSIATLEARGQARLNAEVALTPAADASYHVGDSLLVSRIDREVVGGWGEVIVPVGIVRVTEVQSRQVLGRLVAQFGTVRPGQVAMPIEPFHDPGQVRSVPVEQGLQGEVIALRDEQPLVGSQDYVFIDKGRRDGVALGDVFEVFRPADPTPGAPSEEVHATLLVVHARERSATGLLIGVSRGDMQRATPVRLIRKMPS